jgi:hypothetical protein
VTPSELTALVGALTALIVAVGALLVQVRQLHGLVNSRMGELLELTRRASLAEGKLAGPVVGAFPTDDDGVSPTDSGR